MAERVRLYHSVRSAHLERVMSGPRTTIVYCEKRYDFDEVLGSQADLVDGSGLRAAWYLLTQPPRLLEINEPLMRESALWTAGCLLAVRLRDLPRRRTTVVSYAIENRDPRLAAVPARWRGRLRRVLEQAAMRWMWGSVDRLAFGTDGAQALYHSYFHGRRPAERLIWALPAAGPAGGTSQRGTAVFASAFSPRKGVEQLLRAWPDVCEQVPGARLVMIGVGALLPEVCAAAASHPSIEVLVDPPRSVISEVMGRAKVVVLPSQPTDSWREQVGLPIVEGLSHGCTVVTTTETGLASWLSEHGHLVFSPGTGPGELTSALVSALTRPLDPAEVRRSLPATDGRLAADDWLCEAT